MVDPTIVMQKPFFFSKPNSKYVRQLSIDGQDNTTNGHSIFEKQWFIHFCGFACYDFNSIYYKYVIYEAIILKVNSGVVLQWTFSNQSEMVRGRHKRPLLTTKVVKI